MIHLVFVDASLELVPEKLLSHPAVRKYAKRFNKGKEILLDDSYHHSTMKKLDNREKRGRPDIIHFCLLEAFGSPLCVEGKLSVYVHTLHNKLLMFDPKTRLPRNYNRFKGLMEEVFREKRSKNGLIAMEEDINLENLFNKLECQKVIGLSSKGKKIRFSEIFKEDTLKEDIVLIIGAFPKGHFSSDVKNLFTNLISIFPEPLDAWVVTSRVLCQIETLYGLI